MDSITSRPPKYLQLAKTLLREIEGGVYPVGSLLPTESDLCEQFGASRFTVREAIKKLVERGLVNRKPSVGTRVLATESKFAYRQVMEHLTDVRQYAADTRLVVFDTKTIEVDQGLSKFLCTKVGMAWLYATGIRRGPKNTLPVCFVEIFIHPLYRSIRNLRHCATIPVYTMIEKQFGERIVELRHELRATTLTKDLAGHLKSKPKGAALVVAAQYFNDRGDMVQASISTHPADRFSYVGAFRRDWSREEDEGLRNVKSSRKKP
jgi:GntR family transcriptional regulator